MDADSNFRPWNLLNAAKLMALESGTVSQTLMHNGHIHSNFPTKNMVLQGAAGCCRVLQGALECYKVIFKRCQNILNKNFQSTKIFL